MLLESHTAYSSSKHAFQCKCSNMKHARFLQLQTIERLHAVCVRARAANMRSRHMLCWTMSQQLACMQLRQLP